MKRVNIALPDELHTKAKVLAVLNHKTLNEYLTYAINQAVKEDKKMRGLR